ncbi:MAG: polysaccharide pyruvyl transferase family protein [Ruminococcaceae bacterium]|nr:polysaccharide pyruvyl transferase family protein [Oscillospiraceae bacterium]
MKIGILTFPKAINYGAALQAAALSRVLSDRSHDVYFLSHINKNTASASKVFDITKILNIKYSLAHIINLPVAVKRKLNFSDFWKKHFRFDSAIPHNYDLIITGSDQVWNYNLTGDDWFFYLDFEKNNTKKAAYSASFGLSEIATDRQDKIRTLINDIDFLSVREKTAAKLISELCEKEATVTVDPTLLLTKEQWCKFFDKKEEKKGYIFVYTLFNSDKIWEYAKFLSNKTGLPIKTISYSKLHRHNAIYNFTAGPDDWVNYMLNADYVVTNSFHGVAFSINFNKNFFFDMPPEKAGVGSRISDITERYSLSHRNISAPNFVETAEAPDFSAANKLLEEDRFFSFSFIDSFLNSKSAPEEE